MQLVEPRPNRPIPIRITPLIDVVFILLVFFMLTSRLLPVGYLELGNDTSQPSSVTGEPVPVLVITNEGAIRWQDDVLSLGDVISALSASGITEVNLSTQPQTELAQFTRVLTGLDAKGIETHWKRATDNTP
ncbi:MAG: biopolymer transporter ExbD [Gammaproteobacteria bacterium]|uniref:Ferric siderophore transport system,innermembrane protein E n=1 Tax=Marinobacter nitratireducens TaxID=1137280 RepID=A0A072MYY4_9GAMM|nr:biopolymer transporter ExbD [Marinobacter nitratireducens]KEF29943.1 ferric siderophore transport system,innermembrane protein E [Marinobacter nitratireducens]TNE72906.1 MAG: biopolymer transporter ExbD [Gammaproteobacteria bacterium]